MAKCKIEGGLNKVDIEQEDNIKEEIKDKEEQSKDNNEKSDKKKSNKITKIISKNLLTK